MEALKAAGQSGPALSRYFISDVNLFRYRESIIHLNAEVPDGAFNLGVAEQELHGSQVTSVLVDRRDLSTPERMGAKELRIESDTGEPFGYTASILARRHALADAAAARE